MRHIDMYLDVVQKKKQSGGGGTGGITPSGTKVIKVNGKHDVTSFATADVQVPIPEAPSGKKVISVTENGVTTHDVTDFAQAEVNVNVPVPEEPAGEKVVNITSNGTTTEDVKAFASAKINVQVPNEGITPSGVKEIVTNGVHDVTQFAQAKVEVPMPAEPTGTKEITSNGTHDVKAFANVNVAVPVGVTPQGTKEIEITANGEKTEDVSSFKNVHIVTNVPSAGGGAGVPQEKYDSLLQALQTQTQAYSFTNADITSLRDSAFYNDKQLSSVTLQNATHVGANAFERCTLLSKCSVDKMQTCGDSAFSRANLSQAVFPNLSAIARNMFVFCSYLKKVKCDKAISIDERAFNGCASLEVIDILGGGNISAPSTSELYKLKSVVLRGTENVTPTSDTIWLPSSVTIYVPDSLVEQYKSATNWSSRTIKPLSEYVEV